MRTPPAAVRGRRFWPVNPVRQGIGRYVLTIARLAVEDHEQPSAQRCEAMSSWAPRIAADGREAVQRARRNGLMDEQYGLLMGLLVR
ncbi:MAG: hypothetical protein ABL932_20435 [Terricaulis sp.]